MLAEYELSKGCTKTMVDWKLTDKGYEIKHANAHCAVCFLHGLGANALDFVEIANNVILQFNGGVNCLLAQAESIPVSINQNLVMPAWYDIYSLTDFAKQDVKGMESSAKKIASWVQCQNRQGVDAKNIFLIGFSQGGAMALFSVLSGIVKIGHVIGIATYLPAAQHLSRIKCFTDFKLSLMHGKHDSVINPAVAIASSKKLSEILSKKINIEWSNSDHSITLEQIKSLMDILQSS